MSAIEQPNNNAWGLPLESVQVLGEKLRVFWDRFRGCFKTKTRDTSEYGYNYMSAQLRMETNRNFANIGRESGDNIQNIQQFMSDSPWSSQSVLNKVQEEIKNTPALQVGGVLILDESADAKSGNGSVGAGRQYNGRLGKVDMSQVGVFIAYANLTGPQSLWTWVDGDLFLPESWFCKDHYDLRINLGVPNNLKFKTKIEIGWDLILKIQSKCLLFELIACDCLYGRSGWLRFQMRDKGITYMAEIPSNTHVYLQKPALGVPAQKFDNGRQPTKIQVLSEEKPVQVESLRDAQETEWKKLSVRVIERGELCDPFAVRRVWTVYEGEALEEWLVMRQEANGKYSYALCNAPASTQLSRLAWWKCQRYFVERANQDAKSELGWDELEAQKYLSWQHHLALTILASWFVAQTKYELAERNERQPELLKLLDVDVLPALSFANIRLLLRAVMPLNKLTPEQAIDRVIEHLLNRTYSRKSRMKNHRRGAA